MPLFELPSNVRDTWPGGARDFDFLEGEWVIRHRRLRERLKGSNDWVEFETPMVMQPILGGIRRGGISCSIRIWTLDRS